MSTFKINKKDTLITLTYSPGRDIWNGMGKSSKSGQGKKSLISTFACFLTATAEV